MANLLIILYIFIFNCCTTYKDCFIRFIKITLLLLLLLFLLLLFLLLLDSEFRMESGLCNLLLYMYKIFLDIFLSSLS